MTPVRQPRVYDKAKYHYENENYPSDLPKEQALVHTGMFIAWLVENDLLSAEMKDDFRDVIADIKARRITGARAYAIMGSVFAGDMLTEEGRRFTAQYYDGDDYLADYVDLLAADERVPSVYHVKDTWDHYDLLRPRIDERYRTWKTRTARGAGKRKSPRRP